MRKLIKIGLTLFACLVIPAGQLSAQNLPDDVCRVEGDQLIYRINTKWTDQEFQQFISNFSLDSTFIKMIELKFAPDFLDSLGFGYKKDKGTWMEISVPLNDGGDDIVSVFSDFFLMDQMLFDSIPKGGGTYSFGSNKLIDKKLLAQKNDQIQIQLKGYSKASKVYIAGSFNQWSTSELPLTKNTEGWEINLELDPGKYLYKFIVDGKWINDPNNHLQEKDTEYNTNSVFYVSNHRFLLNGHERSKRVFVSGSFNNFSKRELEMEYDQVSGAWFLDVFLPQGTYYYKFIVNGRWIPDPENPDIRSDKYGNQNSVIGIGNPSVFYLDGYQQANNIRLTGSFNDWNPEEIEMVKGSKGWTTAYILGPGTYQYKFIVDNSWISDPANPYTSGSGDYVNSVITINPNFEFRLDSFSDAKTVIVSGSFNNWDESGYEMKYYDDAWHFPIWLPPGKYTYKFIVDGRWMLDPSNELWEENRYGTDNSVLWIDQ